MVEVYCNNDECIHFKDWKCSKDKITIDEDENCKDCEYA